MTSDSLGRQTRSGWWIAFSTKMVFLKKLIHFCFFFCCPLVLRDHFNPASYSFHELDSTPQTLNEERNELTARSPLVIPHRKIWIHLDCICYITIQPGSVGAGGWWKKQCIRTGGVEACTQVCCSLSPVLVTRVKQSATVSAQHCRTDWRQNNTLRCQRFSAAKVHADTWKLKLRFAFIRCKNTVLEAENLVKCSHDTTKTPDIYISACENENYVWESMQISIA